MNPAAGAKPTVFLRDYRAPAWRVDEVALEFDLDPAATIVAARLHVVPDPDQAGAPLRLDGEGLELIELRIDGRVPAPGEYELDAHALTIHGLAGPAVIETRARIAPEHNTALQGLYLSGARDAGFLVTQCEAEGFRRITWFLDRPDVLARYTVTLRADKTRFPLLLSNGNEAGRGDLDGGRHFARFVDPHPKPSYLFALVAGRLDRIEDEFVTAEGRRVRLAIHAESDLVARCAWAMQCLKMAMRWDEQRFGRCYDLDVFHVVATRDFTMGAMENKGLNIFNAKYLVADPEHATDDDYRHVLAVVGHEYFHNWTGNRVTCRDWFQLSLKEGLTVYREQEFESDLASRTLRRIEDVRTLWRSQFSEDAGPLAHPVRPDRYSEINNFYTATVYDKGAEVVRMLAVLLGSDGFRRGLDLYFDAPRWQRGRGRGFPRRARRCERTRSLGMARLVQPGRHAAREHPRALRRGHAPLRDHARAAHAADAEPAAQARAAAAGRGAAVRRGRQGAAASGSTARTQRRRQSACCRSTATRRRSVSSTSASRR